MTDTLRKISHDYLFMYLSFMLFKITIRIAHFEYI
jgi:hypothetical protein